MHKGNTNQDLMFNFSSPNSRDSFFQWLTSSGKVNPDGWQLQLVTEILPTSPQQLTAVTPLEAKKSELKQEIAVPKISPLHVDDVINNLSKGKLTALQLTRELTQGWTDHDFKKVFKALSKYTQLFRLELRDIQLKSELADHLKNSIRKNKKLVIVHLHHCGINDELGSELVTNLQSCPNLKKLCMDNNPVGDKTAAAIQKLLEKESSILLNTLTLQDTNITTAGYLNILMGLKKRNKNYHLENTRRAEEEFSLLKVGKKQKKPEAKSESTKPTPSPIEEKAIDKLMAVFETVPVFELDLGDVSDNTRKKLLQDNQKYKLKFLMIDDQDILDKSILDAPFHTPLTQALKNGDMVKFEQLLSQQDVNQLTQFGHSALAYAAYYGNHQAISMLLAKGAKAHYQTHSYSPLDIAILQHENYIAQQLIIAGADIHGTDKKNPLNWAVTANNLPAITLLANKGVNLNIKMSSGDPAVFTALNVYNVEAVKLLHGSGADMQLTLSLETNNGTKEFSIEEYAALLRITDPLTSRVKKPEEPIATKVKTTPGESKLELDTPPKTDTASSAKDKKKNKKKQKDKAKKAQTKMKAQPKVTISSTLTSADKATSSDREIKSDKATDSSRIENPDAKAETNATPEAKDERIEKINNALKFILCAIESEKKPAKQSFMSQAQNAIKGISFSSAIQKTDLDKIQQPYVSLFLSTKKSSLEVFLFLYENARKLFDFFHPEIALRLNNPDLGAKTLTWIGKHLPTHENNPDAPGATLKEVLIVLLTVMAEIEYRKATVENAARLNNKTQIEEYMVQGIDMALKSDELFIKLFGLLNNDEITDFKEMILIKLKNLVVVYNPRMEKVLFPETEQKATTTKSSEAPKSETSVLPLKQPKLIQPKSSTAQAEDKSMHQPKIDEQHSPQTDQNKATSTLPTIPTLIPVGSAFNALTTEIAKRQAAEEEAQKLKEQNAAQQTTLDRLGHDLHTARSVAVVAHQQLAELRGQLPVITPPTTTPKEIKSPDPRMPIFQLIPINVNIDMNNVLTTNYGSYFQTLTLNGLNQAIIFFAPQSPLTYQLRYCPSTEKFCTFTPEIPQVCPEEDGMKIYLRYAQPPYLNNSAPQPVPFSNQPSNQLVQPMPQVPLHTQARESKRSTNPTSTVQPTHYASPIGIGRRETSPQSNVATSNNPAMRHGQVVQPR